MNTNINMYIKLLFHYKVKFRKKQQFCCCDTVDDGHDGNDFIIEIIKLCESKCKYAFNCCRNQSIIILMDLSKAHFAI